MHHSLANASFETVLGRVDDDIAGLNGIPALEQAKADYKTTMREAIALATKASKVATRPERIDGNASARAQAAKATYHLMEATNLHCAGER